MGQEISSEPSLRVEFERWADTKAGYPTDKFISKDVYIWPHVQDAWDIWQEIRAELSIK